MHSQAAALTLKGLIVVIVALHLESRSRAKDEDGSTQVPASAGGFMQVDAEQVSTPKVGRLPSLVDIQTVSR